ncbi:SDR family oxidoreductase [Opitutus terrae]|uniref:Short-chain dehydrogenase/reductase SDR n=1 Tax=Opitutus terrae (strain DSM 11246 / JCM 15787 / PB90-1) TaxID=452637 RepID=B1ZU60_OPITP|nr:SDR family oxidoreductase [Opitutus terrae]ACB76626.1 short-chain dehydrogenase/reductase SDR [Opitutus terrae PB90-1]
MNNAPSSASASIPPPVVSDPPRRLEKQIALVTGSGSGLGREIAIELARAGAAVVINYAHSAKSAEQTASEIRAEGGRALVVQGDVSREADVQAMFRRTCEECGTVDILVNNAGIEQDVAFDEMTLAQWQKVIDVNLTGQFLCAREAVRQFKRRGVRPEISSAAGKIICISSVHEVIPWAGHVNYCASKGGVMLMMKSLAQEVARDRIRVNSIAPGAIRTDINRHAWETPEAMRQLLTMIPYGRIGEPADVGRLAVWLASDQSDYITGTTIFIDGGMVLYPAFSSGKG